MRALLTNFLTFLLGTFSETPRLWLLSEPFDQAWPQPFVVAHKIAEQPIFEADAVLYTRPGAGLLNVITTLERPA
jgi:hypothetical protein